MATVAVFGAFGFIGHHVALELARRGHTVRGFDRRSSTPFDLDVEIPAAQTGDIAIHAAEPGVATDDGHAERCLGRLRHLIAAPFERIIYISSAVVYGDEAGTPRSEASPTNPRGPYALAKMTVEQEAMREQRCTTVRLANVYGSGMAMTNVLSDMLAQVPRPGPVELRDLAPVRDYIHVTDVARAVTALVENPQPGLFNIGTGRGYSVEQLARIVNVAAGQPGRDIVATLPSARSSYLVLDPSKAQRELGWQSAVTVEAGLTELVREIVK